MHLGHPDHPLRRSEKAVCELSEIESILQRPLVLRLAMCDGDRPYIVPLNFAYHDQRLYMHSAREGRKLDILRANPNVCFEMDLDVGLVEPADPAKACGYTMHYRSIVGSGTATIHEDPSTIAKGLDILMARYSDHSFEYPETALSKTTLIVVTIDEICGKQAGVD